MKAKSQITGPTAIGNSYHTYYNTWHDMMRRCYNPERHNYKYYGGRGIGVCERWHNFQSFIDDMGVRPKDFSLDRIDNNQDYSPENCKWSSRRDQASNRRGYTNTGIKGVRFNHGKYEAWVGNKYLGRFNTVIGAVKVKNAY